MLGDLTSFSLHIRDPKEKWNIAWEPYSVFMPAAHYYSEPLT
jgi:hypothetical protein